MGLFSRRSKKDPRPSSKRAEPAGSGDPAEVGVVSGVLSTRRVDGGETPHRGIVERRFGPDGQKPRRKARRRPPERDVTADAVRVPAAPAEEARAKTEARRETRSAPAPGMLVEESFAMAHVGNSTKITGDIVADEDLEMHGTVEGTVQLPKHQLTVGEGGNVKGRVKAARVVVAGRVDGDVEAASMVEVHTGGYVGGNVTSPRVILHDGAIVIGGLDMSAALDQATPKPGAEPKPRLKKVESAPEAPVQQEGSA